MHMTFLVSRAFLLPEKGDPHRYFSQIKGSLVHGGRQVGTLSAVKIQFGDMSDDAVSWFDTCDSRNQDTHDWYSAMCEGDDYRDFIEVAGGSDLLVLESAEIIQEFRGRDLGLVMVFETLRTFEGGCAAALIEPHPLRHREPPAASEWSQAMQWPKLATTEKQYAAGAKQLRTYWAQLGFEAVPKTKNRFWYRSTAHEHTVPEERLREQLEPFDDDEDD